jgi:cyclopropane fatty-acyl-phospholipid synthase-like methyltransferase
MAKQTAGANDFALKLLQLRPDDAVLEIGSGHGDTLAKAANTASRDFLCGIDFSTVMHAQAGCVAIRRLGQNTTADSILSLRPRNWTSGLF